jgi:hypothetical protein
LLVAPAAMLPVSKPPLSWVAVCVIESLFFQATVCPTFAVAEAGENDMAPLLPTIVITTSAVVPEGVVGFESLQPTKESARRKRASPASR